MHIKSQKNFFSGVLFMGIGAAFAWGATTYDVGDGMHMGPGYFPLWLGLLMTLWGAVITFTALVVETEGGDKMGKWAWKPLVFIVAANLIFGVLLDGFPLIGLPAMGLIAAIYVLTFVASMAQAGWKIKQTFILATVLAAVSYVAFVLVLRLPFAVWPAFFIG